MPLRTVTYQFDDEEERLESEIEEIEDVIDEVGDVDPNNPAAQTLLSDLQTLQTHLQGVQWARDEAFEADYAPAWDEDVDSVTLGGLTGGEFGALQDDLNQHGGGSGAARVYQVERGTVEAPYLDDSMDENQRIATVSDLPAAYLMWAESRIDDLTGLGGNGQTNYGDLLEELRETTSESTPEQST